MPFFFLHTVVYRRLLTTYAKAKLLCTSIFWFVEVHIAVPGDALPHIAEYFPEAGFSLESHTCSNHPEVCPAPLKTPGANTEGLAIAAADVGNCISPRLWPRMPTCASGGMCGDRPPNWEAWWGGAPTGTLRYLCPPYGSSANTHRRCDGNTHLPSLTLLL